MKAYIVVEDYWQYNDSDYYREEGTTIVSAYRTLEAAQKVADEKNINFFREIYHDIGSYLNLYPEDDEIFDKEDSDGLTDEIILEKLKEYELTTYHVTEIEIE